MHEAQEVFDVVFPTGDQAAEVVQPRERPFHLPASAVTAQFAAVLALAPVAPVGCDQLDPILLGELRIERVRVVGFVTDEPAGSSSRKLPARTYSTSWHSAGEALSTDTARGRLLAAAIAMIFVPLPRRVGPSAKPAFWHSRKWHQRTPLPGSACLARAGAGQAVSAPAAVCRCVPTAESDDGRFDRADISAAFPAIALRFRAPRALRSKPPEYHARDGHDCPARRAGRSTDSTTAHCSSLSSQRPVTGASLFQSNYRIARNRPAAIYETSSSSLRLRSTLEGFGRSMLTSGVGTYTAPWCGVIVCPCVGDF